MIKMLRDADVAYTNFEMLIHNYTSYPLKPIWRGTYMRAPEYITEELKWAGFDIVSCANNHAGDFGPEAMLETKAHLDNAGIENTGTGRNLSEAREPGYLETAKGRIGLISVCSTFYPWEKASRERGIILGRPGLNSLRFETVYHISDMEMSVLKGLSKKLNLKAPTHIEKCEGEYSFLGKRFAVKDEPDIYTIPNKQDFEGNLRSIRDARRQTDWVFLAFHGHESDRDKKKPAKFIETFARNCIDAGADIFIGHGPHVLRGIEIYNGKPIFYSLGNFIAHNIYMERLPSDAYEAFNLDVDATPSDFHDARSGILPPNDPAWFESIIPIVKLKKRTVMEIMLYPITLGFGKERPLIGRPMLTEPEYGKQILKRLIEVSSSYETEIQIENGIGRIKLGK